MGQPLVRCTFFDSTYLVLLTSEKRNIPHWRVLKEVEWVYKHLLWHNWASRHGGGTRGGHAIFLGGTSSSLLHVFLIPQFPYGGHQTNMRGHMPPHAPLVTPLSSSSVFNSFERKLGGRLKSQWKMNFKVSSVTPFAYIS